MNNPWKDLKKSNKEYVATCDKDDMIMYFNSYVLKNDHSLKLNVLPGPYTGDVNKAIVYLLALNPGYDDNDIIFAEKYEKEVIENLSHNYDDYPFLFLNPRFNDTAAAKWCRDKLSHFIDDIGLEHTSKLVCNIEYFPYHSLKYKYIDKILPSQKYSFSFVKNAIKENKIIIIMRGEKCWYKAIPELINYKNKYILNSPLNVKISPNNLGIKEYSKIKDELINSKNYCT